MEKPNPRRRKGQKKRFKTYKACLPFVHHKKLQNKDEWIAFVRSGKKPVWIPSMPDLVYKERGWNGWAEWLGKRMYTYQEAKAIVQKMDILNGEVWRETAGLMFPRPSRMPLQPERVYRTEWEGWTKFLGHEIAHTRHPGPTLPYVPPKRVYRPFDEAIKFVSKLGISGHEGYMKWRGTYEGTDLPWRPDEIYAEEWLGWGAFTGNKPLVGLLTDTSVLYVARRAPDPSNVYQIHIEAMGKSHLMHRAQKEDFKIMKVWKYDPTLREEVRSVIDANARPYGGEHDYIVENIFGLYGDLFNLLVVAS